MPVTTTATANGQPTRQQVADLLCQAPLTAGYRPPLPLWHTDSADWFPQIHLLRDVEIMLVHPVVRSVLNFYKGGIAGAEFWGGPNPEDPKDTKGLPVCPDNPAVSAFVLEQCNRFWDRGVPLVQGGYEYGWIGTEQVYGEEYGQLRWSHLEAFSPRDTFLLTHDNVPVGVRVKNVKGTPGGSKPGGDTDLFMASRDIPAKGIWYTHNPRYGGWHGQSQVLGSWRPWRRLAWKDSAETVLDTAYYRFGFCGPEVRYPEEDLTPEGPGAPATTSDSQGQPRRYARDAARQIAEWAKTGCGVGLPSTRYPNDFGGGEKWSLKWPDHAFSGDPILAYIAYLCKQISYGIGVPPELMEAAQTGSGYSGRAIPLRAFIAGQQRIADALLWLFVTQVLRPLVRWNFGDVRWEIKVRPLINSMREQETPQQQKAAPENAAESRPGWPRDEAQAAGAAPAAPGGTAEGQPAPGGFSLEERRAADRVRLIARKILGVAA